ncbi:hypothetical protein [Mucilaginibacter gotjawali]|uniref:Uncharacterized protein n=1 Tax=Mucilaginibacter gotjawali TaxID=1550579 RepID=A0A839S9K6_9SPHI|nr:hypothetical protein [Mucilaginibacter gotjawali]MBB3054821.1 hypothetical protein [Mucilaginibacter gotjawali]
MKSRFLFPHWFRYLGYALFLVHVPFVMFRKSIGFDNHDTDTGLFNGQHLFFMATTLLMAVGLFFVAFAKEKIEDEQISQLRLDSLQWAIYLNYLLLIIGLIFTTDTEHILFLNLMVPLFFFIVRFRWVIYRLNRSLPKEG